MSRAPDTTNDRLVVWVILSTLSAVLFGSIYEVSNRIGFGGHAIFSLCVSMFTLVAGGIFSVILMAKLRGNGSKAELSVIVISGVFWGIALPVIFDRDSKLVFATDINLVRNANIYYGSWAVFGCTLRLCALYLQQVDNINVVKALSKRSSRFLKWSLLSVSSLIVMGSSTKIFRTETCKDPSSSLLLQNMDETAASHFCKCTALGIGIGASSLFVCLLILSELVYLGNNVEELLETEALFSFLICVSNAVSVAYITGDNGPASAINNLYYSLWLSFILTISLVLSCIREMTKSDASDDESDADSDTASVEK